MNKLVWKLTYYLCVQTNRATIDLYASKVKVQPIHFVILVTYLAILMFWNNMSNFSNLSRPNKILEKKFTVYTFWRIVFLSNSSRQRVVVCLLTAHNWTHFSLSVQSVTSVFFRFHVDSEKLTSKENWRAPILKIT